MQITLNDLILSCQVKGEYTLIWIFLKDLIVMGHQAIK